MILFDRGGIVDEYASVPEYHGPLPPGEVIALRANPVVVERYTGATPGGDPGGDARRRLARRAAAGAGGARRTCSAALGLTGAEHGWADAPGER